MKSKLIFSLVVEHDEDYDPAEHFVWYFSDDDPEPVVMDTLEKWTDLEDGLPLPGQPDIEEVL